MLERLLVTGAAGGVANLLRPRLQGVCKKFRLTDIRHFASVSDSLDWSSVPTYNLPRATQPFHAQ